MRGMNALLRLLLFNVVPTALEAALAIAILGRRYGPPFLAASLVTVGSFVGWTWWVVERRVSLLSEINEVDNRLFSRFFNALMNSEAVRSFVNEQHEARAHLHPQPSPFDTRPS